MKTKRLPGILIALALLLTLVPVTASAANATVKFYAIVPDLPDLDTGNVTPLNSTTIEDAIVEATDNNYSMLVMHFPSGGTYTLSGNIDAQDIMIAISDGLVVVPSGVEAIFGVGFEVGNGALQVNAGGSVTFALADGDSGMVIIGSPGDADWFELTDGYIIVQSVPKDEDTPSLGLWDPDDDSAYLQIIQVFASMGNAAVNTHAQIYGKAALASDYPFMYNDLVEISPGSTFTIPAGKTAKLHHGAVISNFGTLTVYGKIVIYEGEIKNTGTFVNNGEISANSSNTAFVSHTQNASFSGYDIDDQNIIIDDNWLGEQFNPYQVVGVPTLTAGAVNRTSNTSATVRFTSDKTGTYYYIISDTPPVDANAIKENGDLGSVTGRVEVTITNPTGLAAGAKTIYITVEDGTNGLSDVLSITIPIYTPPLSGGGIPSAPNHSFSGNSKYVHGFGEDLVHITQKAFSLFKSVSVDSVLLTRDVEYKAENSSTKITLYHQYLDTLSVGIHTLMVHFTDGTVVTAEFEVLEGKPEQWVNPFADVSANDWFYGDVEYAVTRGLIVGTSTEPMLFSPNMPLSRAMLVTILARHAGIDVTGGETWYSAAWAWGVENGVTDGTNPEGDITREQLAVMLYRYAGSPDLQAGQLEFADVEELSDWAFDALVWATFEEIMEGRPGGLLDPQGMATRAEVTAMLHRFLSD